MGLDDHPLPHAQGLAHTTDRPLFQGSTLGGHQPHVVNASPPHHDVGSEVRLPESLPFRLSWLIQNSFPISSFAIVCHRLHTQAPAPKETAAVQSMKASCTSCFVLQVSQHMQ